MNMAEGSNFIRAKKSSGGRTHDNNAPSLQNMMLFIGFLALSIVLVFNIKIGLLLLTAAILLITVLLKPEFIYFLLISLFSIEGFAAFENVSYPKLLGLLLTLGLSLGFALKKDALPKDSLYKYFYMFFAGSIVSFFFSKELSASLRMYVVYVSMFFLYIFTRYFLRSLDDIHKALNCIFFSTIVVFVFVQTMGLSVSAHASSRISSGIADPNAFAAYILVLTPLVLYRALRSFGIPMLLYWGILLIFLLLLVFTGSRGGMLGFLGASAILIYYYGIGKMRQIGILLIFVTAIGLFVVPQDFWFRASTIIHPDAEKGSAISTRLERYIAAVKMILDHPVAGVGLANFRFVSMYYGASEQGVVHNMYLEILAGGGLLSFVPFSLILIKSWRNLRLKRSDSNEIRDLKIGLKASFCSFLITASFLSADHEKILWFLLALIASAYYLKSSARIKAVAGSVSFSREQNLAEER